MNLMGPLHVPGGVINFGSGARKEDSPSPKQKVGI